MNTTSPVFARASSPLFKPYFKKTACSTAVLLAGMCTLSTPLSAQEGDKGRYSLQLEEILVTAQKREENLMSVPVTVNAFTAQDMVNVGALDIQDIDDFMPGVDIEEGSSTQLTIEVRGVASPNISTGGDPSTATFFDGAYLPRAATSIPFSDIARIEVLKGPQGTLFGRNATAGVINIIPNKPADEFEGFVKARLGNYDLRRFEGMVNTPINDDLALRANLFYYERGAVIDNIGIGDDLRNEGFVAARVALRYDISPDTSIQIAGDIEDRDENPDYSIGVSKYAVSTDPFNSKTSNDVAGREENREMYGISAQIDHAFNEQWALFGITSYREWETINLQDEDGTADPRRYLDSNNIEESDIWYSEVRLIFTDDKFDIILGANYSSENVYQRTDIGLLADSYMQFVSLQLLPEVGIEPTLDSHAWDIFAEEDLDFWLGASDFAGLAVLPPSFQGAYFTETMDNEGEFINWGFFGDVSYQLTDTIRLIGGLRYSYDEKTYSWQTFASGLDWPSQPARVAYDPVQTGADPADFLNKFERDDDWSKTTGRLVLNWEFCEEAMTYLSVSTGYKSGGFDGQVFSGFFDGAYDPEDMTNIEWGLKGDFFDNRLRIEAAIFHQELDSQQLSVEAKESADDPTAQPTIITQDLESDGIELIVQWRPFDTLKLSGLTTIRDSQKTPISYFDGQGEPQGGEKESESTDTDYTLRLDWTPAIPVGQLLVHIDYVFNEAEDKSNETIFTTGPWYFQDRELLSARIAWSNEQDNLEVALWGKNLQDNEIADNPGGFVADALGAYKTSIEDPLTFGIDLHYYF